MHPCKCIVYNLQLSLESHSCHDDRRAHREWSKCTSHWNRPCVNEPHTGTLMVRQSSQALALKRAILCRSKISTLNVYMQPNVYSEEEKETPCTIKSNTFNHRMLKPKGRTKLDMLLKQDSEQSVDSLKGSTILENKNKPFDWYSCGLYKWDVHYLLRCGASKRAECWTMSPHFHPGPKKLAWHSSPVVQADACSLSGTYYS